jgi:hypothetical protein
VLHFFVDMFQWNSNYFDWAGGNTGSWIAPVVVCVPARAGDSLAQTSYPLGHYSSDQYSGGTAVFSGFQPMSPRTVDGVLVRVTTSQGTYRIHMLWSRFSSCADGSAQCGSFSTGFVESDVPSVGASIESSAGADYTYQAPYVTYGEAANGTATGTVTITIPASAITTVQ